MTTAQIFADYLGLTPENAPWAFHVRVCENCQGKGRLWSHYAGWAKDPCLLCNGEKKIKRLTATSPLAPKPTPGWLEVLVMHSEFVRLESQEYDGPFVAEYVCSPDTIATHPTHAVSRALLAADPKLREACEQASDWEEVK